LVENAFIYGDFSDVYQQKGTIINKKAFFFSETLDTLAYSDIFAPLIYLQTN